MAHYTRRDVLKQGAAVTGAATLSAFVPKRAWAKAQLTVWTIGFFNPKADQIIQETWADFAKDAGVDVNVVIVPGPQIAPRIATAVEGGAPPDIAILFDSTAQYYRSIERLMDVTDLVEEMKRRPEGVFPPSLAAVEHGGRAYGVPVALNPWVTHYRKDLLAEAGLGYPKDIFQLAETCKKLQKPPYLYGLGLCLGRALDGVDNIQNILWLFDGWLTKDERTLSIDSRGTVEGLKFLSKLYNEDKIIPKGAVGWDDGSNNKAYQSKQVAFINNPTSVYSYLSVNDQELMGNTGLSPYPPGPAGAFSLIDVWTYGIFNQTKEAKLAKEGLRYVMQPERYQRLVEEAGGRTIPVYRHLTKTRFWQDRPVFTEMLKMPEHGFSVSAKSAPSAAASEVMTAYIIPDMAQEVLLKGVDPADAAKRAHARAQEVFARHYS